MTLAPRSLLVALALCCSLLALPVAAARADRTQQSIMQDEGRLLYSGAIEQARTLDRMAFLGVDIAKVTVNWSRIAPVAKPPGFDGSDPAAYPPGNWTMLDSFVRGATARGIQVYFLLGGRAPSWAAQQCGRAQGSCNPDAAEFARFAQALGTRYSGSYTPVGVPLPPAQACPDGQVFDPESGGCVVPLARTARSSPSGYSIALAPKATDVPQTGPLPRVSLWSVWNEPNLSGWLQPQWRGRRTPVAPAVYRRLLVAAHEGLAASGHAGDQLLIGELLPFARSGKTYPSRISPLMFLRELACVDKRYRPYRGRAAEIRDCMDFKPLPGTGIAHHPYSEIAPEQTDPIADDVSISDLGRMTRALSRLIRAGRFEQRSLPIWLTEFGWQTDPPDPFAFSIRLVPRYMGMSEWFAYSNSRVRSVAQYPLLDDGVEGSGPSRFHGFQSGLLYPDGRAKRRVMQAYQFPFFARLASRSRVELFGGVRAGKPGDRVTLQVTSPGRRSFRSLRGGRLTLGPGCYFDRQFTLRDAGRRSFRFVLATDATKGSVALKPFARPAARVIVRPPPLHKRRR